MLGINCHPVIYQDESFNFRILKQENCKPGVSESHIIYKASDVINFENEVRRHRIFYCHNFQIVNITLFYGICDNLRFGSSGTQN